MHGTTKVASVEQFLLERDQFLQQVRLNLKEAQNRMKTIYDGNHIERQSQVGEWVYLKLQPCRQKTTSTRPNLNLAPKYFGPFKIIAKVSQVAYKLALPEESKLHPIFHVSLLKRKLDTPCWHNLIYLQLRIRTSVRLPCRKPYWIKGPPRENVSCWFTGKDYHQPMPHGKIMKPSQLDFHFTPLRTRVFLKGGVMLRGISLSR